MNMRLNVVLKLAALAAGMSMLAGCERPPVASVQHGYRGTGMEQVYNPRLIAANADINTPPPLAPPASPDGPKAGTIYKNVKVLGDLSIGQFAGFMADITAWVAPKQGCTYCHNAANFADDGIYTKVVARRMIQMNQHINADWKTHVAQTGVTCYTCHRGNNVPTNVWYTSPDSVQSARLFGDHAGQNSPAPMVGLASLPNDPFTPFLEHDQNIRVIGPTALPTGNRQSIKQAEWTYGLMMHMSQSLGVNCTYCHNSRSFASWETSAPQRVTAWYGIRMVRDLNVHYLESLNGVFPPNRLGPVGDVPKLNCGTCHQGAYKPLYGADILRGHPGLVQVSMAASAAASSP